MDIQRFEVVRRNILDLVSDLPSEALRVPFLGSWSVEDLVAHLVGWDYLNIWDVMECIGDEREELAPYERHFPEDWKEDWRVLNARLIERFKRRGVGDLLRFVEISHLALLLLLRTLSNEELRSVAPGLEAEIEDEEEHLEQLKDFARSGKWKEK